MNSGFMRMAPRWPRRVHRNMPSNAHAVRWGKKSGSNIVHGSRRHPRPPREEGDCWAPRGDWLVFKTREQLLPRYVVYY